MCVDYFPQDINSQVCLGFSGSSVGQTGSGRSGQLVTWQGWQDLMCSLIWRSVWGHHSFERIHCLHFVMHAWSSWAKVIALCLSLVGSTMQFPQRRIFWSVMQSSSDICLYGEGSLWGLFFWRLSLICISSLSSVDACWISSIVMACGVNCSAR